MPKNSLLKDDAVEIQPQRRIQSSQGVSNPWDRTILPVPLDFTQKGMLHLLQLAKTCIWVLKIQACVKKLPDIKGFPENLAF